MIRVGQGYDIHRLVKGRPFILAGVQIPCDKGELGHSDGDVLAHAVCDAVLGAAGLGDIGEFFPPTDPAWKDANSMELLRLAFSKVRCTDWHLVNLDCIVCCDKPQVLPHRDGILYALAQALEAETEAVFVKGKTAEGLGQVGKGNAVEAWAVCLLEEIKNNE